MSDELKLTALLQEAADIQEGVQRTYSAIYTSFGVILPAVIGVFVFVAKEDKAPLDHAMLATAFVVVFALGSLWSQSAWMELLRYVRYKYVVLLPRLYAASSQGEQPNFLQWSGRRTLLSWLPILLFNLGALTVLLCAHFGFVTSGRLALQAVSLSFIIAVSIGSVAVIIEARQVEKEILCRG